MSEIVIETKELTKKYNDFVAVDTLNLSIGQGEVFGLLGPNGSGKTTTILMLLGLTEPTSGEVRVLGLDPVRKPLSVKARVGYLPDQIGFYDELTARENLIYIAKLNGLSRKEGYSRIDVAIERMGLGDATNRPVGTFSRGMRQRLGVAELLIKQPQIIIMDEPTLGLDPEAARLFLDIIRDLKRDGITILLSSHLLYQVQAVCDRVGLFYRGQVVLEGSVKELAQRILQGAYRIELEAVGATATIEETLHKLPKVVSVQRSGQDMYVIETRDDVRSEVASAVISAGGQLKSLDMDEPNLDDIYTRYFQEVEHGTAA
ncbi:MAG: ATP-binding cassette domain-containing protein [Chloroflexi bacterium AL-W]|nr:ATP-binding cassette domain-containing protein [Chloroflexi bacterium AL-N1]NOK69533.1 ATP-binding cassette domain-containing protein [Chloroflexi bacterium AL-N10]NOK77498.1 ATP-binding cassette domain-containing protein [Chloroflexi bacterium AL-N5]NOK84349.1 ATP-binding cassette domain-containing protein [Chloroflexi bacterium AL-W]NOK91485.1 ATP-binding cassette domain-containing protein [Chloroflexi bacterium AL-N15]